MEPGDKLDSSDKLGAVIVKLKEVQAAGGKAVAPSWLASNSRPLRKVPADEIRALMVKAVEAEPELAPFAATGPLSTGAVKTKKP